MSAISEVFDPKLIEKKNKAFHRLSKKQQRIAIAKDALQQINLKKYVATPGIYVASDKLENLELSSYDFDLQKSLLGDAPQCEVCGLGAAFCSLARLGNELTLAESGMFSIHSALERVFDEYQLGLIEFAFEGEDCSEATEVISLDDIRAAKKFHNKYDDDDKRLAAIYRNIIKNDGLFKP